jgi:large subunit ribosomal protein L10
MNRQEKQAVIESLKADFVKNPAAFVVGIKGLSVSELQKLRVGLRKEGGTLFVAKNTFARIASDSLSCAKDLQPHLKNQVAVVFAAQDSSSVAKVLCGYEKEHAKFSIIAGCLESRFIDQSMVKYLGSLPSREIVAAQLCGTLKAPITAHVSVLNQLVVRLVHVLKQASEKQ